MIDFLAEKDKRFCELLDCVFSKGVIDQKYEKKLLEMGINLKQLRECLKQYCADHSHSGQKEKIIAFERAITEFRLKPVISEKGTGVNYNAENFGFVEIPVAKRPVKKTESAKGAKKRK